MSSSSLKYIYGDKAMKQKLRILSSDNNVVDLLIEEEIEAELSDDFGANNSKGYSQQIITHEELDDMVRNELEADIDDIIFDALDEYMPPVKGRYRLSEIDIYEKTEQKIRDQYNDIIIYANKRILKRSIWITYKRWGVNFIVLLAIWYTNRFWNIRIDSYKDIFVWVIPYSVYTVIVFFGI